MILHCVGILLFFLLPAFMAQAYFPPDEATAKILKEFHPNRDVGSALQKAIEKINTNSAAKFHWSIKLTVVDELAGQNLAQFVPNHSPDGMLVIDLRITKEGLENFAVVQEELIRLRQMISGPLSYNSFSDPEHWVEVVANARAGSLNAIEKLARTEMEIIQALQHDVERHKKALLDESYTNKGAFNGQEDVMERYLRARTAHVKKLHAEVAEKVKVENKARDAAWKRQKEVFDQLEKNEVKLNDLVAKGDRHGVRKLVEAYLPWDLMEPSETKAWKEWLDALEKPNKENVKLVFRGMDDDLVMKTAKGEPYLMSTVLSKNQGSYTRRLRSLETMRKKIGMAQLGTKPRFGKITPHDPASISVMMKNHATDPVGSPFLSSSDYSVATQFGETKMGAFNIDERRLIPNILGSETERELLTPLFIFPDEVVYFHDYKRIH